MKLLIKCVSRQRENTSANLRLCAGQMATFLERGIRSRGARRTRTLTYRQERPAAPARHAMLDTSRDRRLRQSMTGTGRSPTGRTCSRSLHASQTVSRSTTCSCRDRQVREFQDPVDHSSRRRAKKTHALFRGWLRSLPAMMHGTRPGRFPRARASKRLPTDSPSPDYIAFQGWGQSARGEGWARAAPPVPYLGPCGSKPPARWFDEGISRANLLRAHAQVEELSHSVHVGRGFAQEVMVADREQAIR